MCDFWKELFLFVFIYKFFYLESFKLMLLGLRIFFIKGYFIGFKDFGFMLCLN